MTNLQEIWKDIPGYEGLFQASTLGRIRSLPKLVREKCRYLTKSRFINGTPDEKGYLKTRLWNPIMKTFSSKRFHRLVALTFIANPLNLPQVNHLNGIKDDNRVINLEWIDNLSNMRHAFRTGIRKNYKRGGSTASKKVININTGELYDCAMDAWEKERGHLVYTNFCSHVRKGLGFKYIS